MSASPELSADLQRLLSSRETLVWHGAPDRRSYVVGWLLGGVPLLLFVGPFVFGVSMFVVFMVGIAIDAGITYLAVGTLLAIGVTLGVVFGGCYLLARRELAHAEYAVTDRRLIRFSGIVGRDYSTVDWTAVADLEVTIGLVESRYGTGSLKAITAGSGGLRFSHVPDPYDVLERLESARAEAGR